MKKEITKSPKEGIPEIADIMCNNPGCPTEDGMEIMTNDRGNKSFYRCPNCNNCIIVSKKDTQTDTTSEKWGFPEDRNPEALKRLLNRKPPRREKDTTEEMK